jgi:hypothetical protein
MPDKLGIMFALYRVEYVEQQEISFDVVVRNENKALIHLGIEVVFVSESIRPLVVPVGQKLVRRL